MGATITNRLIKTLKTAFTRGVFFLTTLLMAAGAVAGQATLAWNANTDPAVAGYMIHYGQSSGVYTGTADAGKVTTFTVTGLRDGATYFYVVTAYDAARAASGYSNQASAVVPASAPVANFTANVTSGSGPLAVTFSSTSTGTISSYAWDFGDSTTGTGQNATHTYSTPGTYSVALTVTGPGGSNTQTKTGFIKVAQAAAPPVASFTAGVTSGVAPLAVSFSSTSTGSITSYAWNFGDGTGSGQNVSHTYNTPGTYTVSLTVTGPGGSNTQTKTGYITVSNALPVAAFTASATNGPAQLSVTFTSSSTGTVTSYAWNFGDGTPGSTVQNPFHSYSAQGSYTVALTVTGPGGTNTQTKTNYITVAAPTQPPTPVPVAGFTADKTSGSAALAVNFTSTSTGSISSYLWTFGDGVTSTSSSQNPTHTYSNPGTYSVSLKVTGSGGSNTLTKSGYIVVSAAVPAPPPPAAPKASFTASSTSGLAPLGVTFTSTSTGTITTYSWNFGDGGNSTAQTPTYTYTKPGTYSVSLTVAGPGGSNMQTRAGYMVVSTVVAPPPPTPVAPPKADFGADVQTGTAPMNVQFTSTSTGTITSYLWDFGDGTTSVEQSPTHSYANAGTYSVSLSVTGPGGSDVQSRANFITASAPIAAPAGGGAAATDSGRNFAGCTVGRIGGTGIGLDPIFPAMLLLAGGYVLRRRRDLASVLPRAR